MTEPGPDTTWHPSRGGPPRSLPDRVLGLLEEDQPVTAVLALAETLDDHERRLAELEQVVPPPTPPTDGRIDIPKGPPR